MKNISDLTVRNSDGTLNLSASADQFLAHLQEVEAQGAELRTQVGEAIESIFDEQRGKALSKEVLVSMTFAKLDGPTDQYAAIQESVDQYLKRDGYESRKGRNGGTRRLADGGFPEPKTKTAAK